MLDRDIVWRAVSSHGERVQQMARSVLAHVPARAAHKLEARDVAEIRLVAAVADRSAEYAAQTTDLHCGSHAQRRLEDDGSAMGGDLLEIGDGPVPLPGLVPPADFDQFGAQNAPLYPSFFHAPPSPLISDGVRRD